MSYSRNTGKEPSNNNQAATSTPPSTFPTVSIQQYAECFTAYDYDALSQNENARYLPNSKSGKVSHAVFITKPNGEKVAVQYLIPSKNGPQIVPLENIQEINRFGMTRYKATALGKTMYAKRFTHGKFGNVNEESEFDIGYFSDTEDGKEPFWGSEKEVPLFRDDLSQKEKAELDAKMANISVVTKGGEELIIDPESVRERDANKVRNPDQNRVMGRSARDAYEAFYKSKKWKAYLSDEMKKILKCSYEADLNSGFGSNERPEWLHAEGWSLTPTDRNPQREDNLGAAPKWANTEMMVLERMVKWSALNRPESFEAIAPEFEMLLDTELINHIHFEVTVQEKENWVRFIQDINIFVKHHLYRKASDLAQATAIAYNILHDVPPIGEPQVVTHAVDAKNVVNFPKEKKSLLSIANPAITHTSKSENSVDTKSPKPVTVSLFKNPVSNAVKNNNHKSSFPTHSSHEKSIVRVSTTFHEPNYAEPWLGSPIRGCHGSGLVIEINGQIYILTNAHCVENAVRILVQLDHARKKYEAERVCVSYQCDLALLKVNDPEFNQLVQSVEIGEMVGLQQKVKTIGFPMGGDRFSITKGIVSRIETGFYEMGEGQMLQVQIDAAINPGNSGGPVFSDDKVVGVAFQGIAKGQNLGYMIPVPIIKHFLTEASSGKPYRGFPILPVNFHILENQSLRKYYGMTPNQTGIRIASVSKSSDAFGKLKMNDILLEIDSHPVSNEGTVDIEGVGNCIDLIHLTHMKYVGDTVELKILRKNKDTSQYETHNISVVLDHVPFEVEKIPQNEHDKMPTYYFASGICFVPVTRNYLDMGDSFLEEMYVWEEGCLLVDSSRKNPDEQIIIISDILDSEATEGYDNFKGTIITTVNNKPVNNIHDLIEAIENNKNEMHEVTTFKKSTLVFKNMSREEHAKLLKTHMIHRDRSDDLLPEPIKSFQDKPVNIMIDDDDAQIISTQPKNKAPAQQNREKGGAKLKNMSPGAKLYFEKVAELENRYKNTLNEEDTKSYDLDESIDDEMMEEDSENEYENDSFVVSDSDSEEMEVEEISTKTKKRPRDDSMKGFDKNHLFAHSSRKANKLLDSEDSEEYEISTKRQRKG